MTLATYSKDPADVIDYTIDYSAVLNPRGDGIATSAWAVSPAGPTIGVNTIAGDKRSATVWLSGGTAATSYTLTNTITTLGGRTIERSLTISVEQM